jgi:hypothetical protein
LPHSIPYPQEKPPFLAAASVSEESLPSLVTPSKGKGKLKWVAADDDDIPLAKLKKSRTAESSVTDSLSPLEIAAYSLTQLQHAAPSIGPVHDFLVQPLHQFQGQLSGLFPQPAGFAPEIAAGSALVDHPATVSDGSRPSSPASVAVSPRPSRRLSRSPRGRRRAASAAMVSHPASLSQLQPDTLEECPNRPPPHA